MDFMLVNITLGENGSTLNGVYSFDVTCFGGSYSTIQAVESSGLHNIKCY